MFVIKAEEFIGRNKKMPLGRQGENLARYVRFNMKELIDEFGVGTFQWVNRRPSEELPYIATNVSQIDDDACWNLTDVDTGVYGEGNCELRYYVDGVLCKTLVWNTIITKSLMQTGEVPDPYVDMVEAMAQSANAARAAADEAAASAAHFVIDETIDGTSTNAVQNSAIHTAVNQVNSRIDNIITEGTSVEDAELLDVRVGYDGTIYDSAGTSVREQVGDLHDEVTNGFHEQTINTQVLLDEKIDDGYVEDGVAYFTSNGVIKFSITGIGGGGGGGGGGNNAEMSMSNASGWLSKTISEGNDCPISVLWSSIEDNIPTGNGVMTITANGSVRAIMDVSQGTVTFNAKSYVATGTNIIRVNIVDVYGNSRTINYTVNVVTLSLRSSFDSTSVKDGAFVFPYTPTGNVEKTVYFILDGVQIGTAVVTASGRQQSYTIPAQTHGAHTLRVYFEAEVNAETVRSNELFYDVICVVDGNTTPIIASAYSETETEQYTTLAIPYIVYDPSNLTASVTLKANGATVNTVTVDRTEQTWSYRADAVGNLALTIAVGSVTKTFNLTVSESSVASKMTTEDLVLSLSAAGRSNSEANPEVWTDGTTSCTLTGFNFSSDGWQSDGNGSTVLRVSGDARVAIPYKAFQNDFRITGKTIEIDFATRDVLNYDSPILTCMDSGRGILLTAQGATLASEQSTVNTQYKENEHIRLTFVVEKRAENRLIYQYLNGVMCGVIQYPVSDDFSQQTAQDISIGSNYCTMDIYAIRIYDNDLSRYQVLDNWIADTQNVTEMLARYNHNNVYDEYDNIVIAKLPTDLPYMIITCPQLPQKKGDKKTVTVDYVDPSNAAKSFTASGVQADVQGTSSQYYARKNYKLKFKNGFVINGTQAETYKLRSSSIGTNTFTMKADVASSEGANNVELARLYNDTCPYKTPAQVNNSAVRQGIDGFPCVIFWNNGSETIFLGKYNFNNDKGTEEVFGFVSDDESWEIRNNTSDRVVWKSDDYTSMGVDEDGKPIPDWLNDFEARYPDTDPAYTDSDQLSSFATWAKSTDTTTATDEALPSSVTYDGVTYTTDSAAYRLAKFKAEAGNYMELESAIFYYLFTELFLMVDSRAKNAFPSFIGGSTT